MSAHICIAPGSINIDLKLKTTALKGAKTFKGFYIENQGGKGFDQAVVIRLASREQREVYLIGCVGRDAWGNHALEKLKVKGVNTDFIKFTDRCRTGVALEHVFGDGQVTVALDLGANNELTTKDIDNAGHLIKNAKILITQLENPIDVVEYSIKLAKSNHVITFLDPSIPPEKKNERELFFDQILPNVDILAPNRSEAEILTGVLIQDKGSAVKAAGILLERVKIVIITLGKEGALIVQKGHDHFIPGLKVTSIDNAAAGDTFRGVFCEALLQIIEEKNLDVNDIVFEDFVKSAQLANYAAALCTTKQGTYHSLPTRVEIEEFKKNYLSVTGIEHN